MHLASCDHKESFLSIVSKLPKLSSIAPETCYVEDSLERDSLTSASEVRICWTGCLEQWSPAFRTIDQLVAGCTMVYFIFDTSITVTELSIIMKIYPPSGLPGGMNYLLPLLGPRYLCQTLTGPQR